MLTPLSPNAIQNKPEELLGLPVNVMKYIKKIKQ
jgi:hypothetical protein